MMERTSLLLTDLEEEYRHVSNFVDDHIELLKLQTGYRIQLWVIGVGILTLVLTVIDGIVV